MLSRRALTGCFLGTLSSLAFRRAHTFESKAHPGLFDSMLLRRLQLPNRMVMAPMTRGRAGVQRTANLLMAEHYSQRATAGLIVTEATAISPQGYGWMGSPAIYTEAHLVGWKGVTDAVHRQGGRIFLQLWHTGRVSHPDFLDGEAPIASVRHSCRWQDPYAVWSKAIRDAAGDDATRHRERSARVWTSC